MSDEKTLSGGCHCGKVRWDIHHLFCSTCGVRSFGRGTGPDGKKMVAVNVRCVDDLDVKPLDVQWYDGKSM